MSVDTPKFQDFNSAIPLDVERRHSMWTRLRLGHAIIGDSDDARQALSDTMVRLATAHPDIYKAAVNLQDVPGEIYVLTGEEQHEARIAELTAYLGALSADSEFIKYYTGEIGGPNDLTNETLAWVSPGHDLAWSVEAYGVNAVAIDAQLPPPQR